jgi:hypothetical protein
MRKTRVAAVAVLGPALLTLAACSSTIPGQGARAGAATATTSAGAPQSAPTDAAGLSALLRRGIASITSAHIDLDITVADQMVHGTGDEEASGGKFTALDLTETLPGTGTLRLRIVDGKTYAILPPALKTPGKPWVLLTADSSNPVIRSLSTSLSSAENAASLATPGLLVAAAKSVELIGTESVGGTPARHYAIVVDVSKLPASYPGRQAITAAGVTTVPGELWVDSAGRTVKVVDRITVQGQSISSQVTQSRFNAPVHITAPPADQVSTS